MKKLIDAAAGFADLGTLLPLILALHHTIGLPIGRSSVALGVGFILASVTYRAPVPVQPLKAASAIAIASALPANALPAAGFVVGLLALIAAFTPVADWLAKVPPSLIRGNQLAVGLLLVAASGRLGGGTFALLLAGLVVVRRNTPVAAILVLSGVVWSMTHASPLLPPLNNSTSFSLADVFFVIPALVIPQLPLTATNAIAGTSALMRELHPAAIVSTRRLLTTTAAMNLSASAIGGVPLCHGSSGVTAYHSAGGRTGLPSALLGVMFLALGLSGAAGTVATLVPLPVLGALLAATGFRHAALVSDRRGFDLVVAASVGLTGAASGNLTIGLATGAALLMSAKALRSLAMPSAFRTEA